MGAKKDLYKFVEEFKLKHSFDISSCTIQEFCQNEMGIKIESMYIRTGGLRAMATPAFGNYPAIILLNEGRSSIEKKFDCAHELMHLVKQPNVNISGFRCYEKIRPKQNPYLEWEANEGAAELIMPYKDFIPEVVNKISLIEGDKMLITPEGIMQMELKFKATMPMIENRIRNLKYETFQYLSGIRIEDLDIKSFTEQRKSGIDLASFCIDPRFSIPKFDETICLEEDDKEDDMEWVHMHSRCYCGYY